MTYVTLFRILMIAPIAIVIIIRILLETSWLDFFDDFDCPDWLTGVFAFVLVAVFFVGVFGRFASTPQKYTGDKYNCQEAYAEYQQQGYDCIEKERKVSTYFSVKNDYIKIKKDYIKLYKKLDGSYKVKYVHFTPNEKAKKVKETFETQKAAEGIIRGKYYYH